VDLPDVVAETALGLLRLDVDPLAAHLVDEVHRLDADLRQEVGEHASADRAVRAGVRASVGQQRVPDVALLVVVLPALPVARESHQTTKGSKVMLAESKSSGASMQSTSSTSAVL
jgi:hypothetical protein